MPSVEHLQRQQQDEPRRVEESFVEDVSEFLGEEGASGRCREPTPTASRACATNRS
jgi:hypothetical protein